jgi:8-oxo-dGTP pyrophosphatase MutT (NUDIX family)
MSATPDTNKSRTEVKDFLLEEYRAVTDSLAKNELTGETRVNWLIGVVTAAVGGLVGLCSAKDPLSIKWLCAIVLASLFSLLIFGMITLLRIMKRNSVTDGFKQDIATIRQTMKDHFDGEHLLLYYRPFGQQAGPEVAGWHTCGTPKKDGGRKLGGLAHIVAAINSLLAAGLLGAGSYFVLSSRPPNNAVSACALVYSVGLAAVAFALAARYQHALIKTYEDNETNKLREGRPTHAGGIVYRVRDGVVEWLIVGPNNSKALDSKERLFPKGHINGSEGHGEAALREIREESGVVARLICLVGRVAFKAKNKDDVDAKYYLMEWLYTTEPDAKENRHIEWLSVDAALEKLIHVESKYLLQEAARTLADLRNATARSPI